jgi:hypothetical protein
LLIAPPDRRSLPEAATIHSGNRTAAQAIEEQSPDSPVNGTHSGADGFIDEPAEFAMDMQRMEFALAIDPADGLG